MIKRIRNLSIFRENIGHRCSGLLNENVGLLQELWYLCLPSGDLSDEGIGP